MLRAAVDIADQEGLQALSMRRLGSELGVEAMSLYNHVKNKEALLDGIVEVVVGEYVPPSENTPWQEAIGAAARSVRAALLRHPWAPALVESRVSPSQVRFDYSEAVIRTFRRAGFSIELAYWGQLTISSYTYGFTLQEVSWPFPETELPRVAESLGPSVTPADHPHLVEMLHWLAQGRRTRSDASFERDFDFGLNLILGALEGMRRHDTPQPDPQGRT